MNGLSVTNLNETDDYHEQRWWQAIIVFSVVLDIIGFSIAFLVTLRYDCADSSSNEFLEISEWHCLVMSAFTNCHLKENQNTVNKIFISIHG